MSARPPHWSPRFYLCLFSVCSQPGSLKETLKKSDHGPLLLQTLQEEAKSSQRLVRLASPVPGPVASLPSASSSAPRTAPHTCPGICTGGVSCSEHPRPRHCAASLTSSSFQGGLPDSPIACSTAAHSGLPLPCTTLYPCQYSALPPYPPELECRLICFVD